MKAKLLLKIFGLAVVLALALLVAEHTAARAATVPQQRTVESYDDPDTSAAQRFSEVDRRQIRDCFRDNRSSLPPGLAKRERLPPGLERQLQRNGKLPPGLQKKVQPMPAVCEARLPRIDPKAEIERVVLGRRIILLGADKVIRDIFHLDRD